MKMILTICIFLPGILLALALRKHYENYRSFDEDENSVSFLSVLLSILGALVLSAVLAFCI